jgi:peptide chain release factor 1
MEYSRIEPVALGFRDFLNLQKSQKQAEEMASDTDPDIRAMAEEEQQAITGQIVSAEEALQRLLIPKDVHDEGNIYLEIRAGAGGDVGGNFRG